VTRRNGGRFLQTDHSIHAELDVEADLRQVEPEEVDLHRIAAEFVFDLGVLDAGVELFEGLGVGFNTEAAKNAESKNQKRKLRE
jgi:hypothetical protein